MAIQLKPKVLAICQGCHRRADAMLESPAAPKTLLDSLRKFRLFGIRLRPDGMVISKPIGSEVPVEKL
jgi:hypothetical protein